ncbi:MAG: hypothetical protein ACLQIH_17220 [Myxococcaceae bacterium]
MKAPEKPPREIWNADFLIDSSVFGVAATAPCLYDRLASQIRKMTSRPELGNAWIPLTALEEMAATPDSRRREVLGVLLKLYRELGDRIMVTGSLAQKVAGEWAEPPYSTSLSLGVLEEDLVACVRGSGSGTLIDQLGADFGAWRAARHAKQEKLRAAWNSRYQTEEILRQGISAALEKCRQPSELYEFCDDLAGSLIETETHRERRVGLALAKAAPEKYLCTWTFALLVRMAQFAQTVPTEERTRGTLGGYAKLLKSDDNDTIDATLAALGAHCGFIITEDAGLRERITFLHGRKVCRLQALNFQDVEANWHLPGATGSKSDVPRLASERE